MADQSEVKKKYRATLGKQCAAWGCESRSLVEFEGKRISSVLSFFTFPKDKGMRRLWCNKIKRVDGKDNFHVTDHTVLCEKHFAQSDIIRTMGGTRKRLKQGAKPTLYENNNDSKKRKEPVDRPSPRKRMKTSKETFDAINELYQQKNNECSLSTRDGLSIKSVVVGADDVRTEALETHELPTQFVVEEADDVRTEALRNHITVLTTEIAHLKKLLLEKQSTVKMKFMEHVLSDDNSLNHYTGLPTIAIFKELYCFLDPGILGENVVLYNYKQIKCGDGVGRPRALSPLESYTLVLVRLRRNFDIQHLSYLFEISEGTVTNTVQTWINHMYLKFGSICIWPTRDQVKRNMPDSMKDKFPAVRIIIDCVEFKVAVPRSLFLHKMMYSDYKSHTTVKVLVGIAPGGGFTFISTAYPGSISDKGIVVKSGLLNSELWEKGDAIMADRGFLIEEYVKPLGVELIMPSFLKGRAQFTESEVVKSQQIAAERIHVERMIQRIKCFHIFDRVIPVNMLGSLNQIISVCAMLCNFQCPILQ